MTLAAQWQATTCADLLLEKAPVVRILLGGYRRTIGRIAWAPSGPDEGSRPLITITQPVTLDADDLRDLDRLTYDAYALAYHVTLDDAMRAWGNSPEAAAIREDLDAGEPPAETCILPAAWDPTCAITLSGRVALDDALTQAVASTATEWIPVHTSSPWTVTWSRV